MDANEQLWTEVGARFAALGRLMKDRYQRRPTGTQPARDAEDSMRRLADALDGIFTTAGETIRDPGVAEEARRAARSLADALSATFDDVDDGLRDRFRRSGTRHRYDRERDEMAND